MDPAGSIWLSPRHIFGLASMAPAPSTQLPPVAGYQAWRNLLFVHWRLPVERVQATLPAGLQVETFGGDAWVGIVPFSMQRIRPWWFPPVPGISWFLETNLRTYVRHPSGQTGVWFYSLDANNRIAVWTARTFWHLNYINADLKIHENFDLLTYSGTRHDGSGGYHLALQCPNDSLTTAADRSLEHFLLERYHLFTEHSGNISCGQVHHPPYQFQQVPSLTACDQTLTECAGLGTLDGPPAHIAWSPGVDVKVTGLQQI